MPADKSTKSWKFTGADYNKVPALQWICLPVQYAHADIIVNLLTRFKPDFINSFVI